MFRSAACSHSLLSLLLSLSHSRCFVLFCKIQALDFVTRLTWGPMSAFACAAEMHYALPPPYNAQWERLWLIVWFNLIVWLIDWLIAWLIDWLIDWLGRVACCGSPAAVVARSAFVRGVTVYAGGRSVEVTWWRCVYCVPVYVCIVSIVVGALLTTEHKQILPSLMHTHNTELNPQTNRSHTNRILRERLKLVIDLFRVSYIFSHLLFFMILPLLFARHFLTI